MPESENDQKSSFQLSFDTQNQLQGLIHSLPIITQENWMVTIWSEANEIFEKIVGHIAEIN